VTVATRARLGFLGVGWIGHRRMQSLAGSGLAEVAAVGDPDAAARAAAAASVAGAVAVEDLEALLDLGLDGIVIATPSALHAPQAITALQRGVAVFCQKPLARTGSETARVLAAARHADRLLGVDLSYRHVAAVGVVRELVAAGALGRLHTLDLAFHNAYGPDKPWFGRRALSGGGCLLDLGTHLVDLALWLTGSAAAHVVAARVLRAGERPREEEVEDFATAELRLGGGVAARIACSWFLPVGRDCAFECTAWGTEGAVSVTNVGGSFEHFRGDRFQGTRCEPLVEEAPGAWGGGAVSAWAQRLGTDPGFDPSALELQLLADTLDRIYERAGR
jgi:predicted dehydrogenase